MKDFAVYLDLDGVLADYDAGIRALGFDIDPSVKNDLNRSGTKNPLKRKMYDKIQGTEFYRTLPLMSGASKLYRAFESADPIILTAAPKFGATEDNYFLNPYWLGAAYHKRVWVEETFRPQTFPKPACDFNGRDYDRVLDRLPIGDERFICTTSARKPEFMHRKKAPYQILVDDRIANCEAWAEAGGIAFLHDGDVEATIRNWEWFQRVRPSMNYLVIYPSGDFRYLGPSSVDF